MRDVFRDAMYFVHGKYYKFVLIYMHEKIARFAQIIVTSMNIPISIRLVDIEFE